MGENYTVGDYLLDRLAQIGIQHLFGVPGDYNLHFLDHVIRHPEIAWVGCANELNAAYAADGYARCRPAAALLTTFGVGELSAINGIAGSYAEYLPVIHIAAAPSLTSQRNGELLHHTLGDGDFNHFSRMAAEVTVAQAHLTVENATTEIDRVIGEALSQHKPVYLFLPLDVAAAPVSTRPYPLVIPEPLRSDDALRAFTAAATGMLGKAKLVSLLADFLAQRVGVAEQIQRWLDKTPLPHATLLMGKGTLNEQHRSFTGTYAGGGSHEAIRAHIEDADVIISIGVRYTDTITTGFSHQISCEKNIDIQPTLARVGNQIFPSVPMSDAIAALEKITAPLAPRWDHHTITPPALPPSEHKSALNQREFWQQMQRFLRPGDILVTDQGTSCFGAATLRLPRDCHFIVQPLWGSIGYSLPAAFGAQIAEPERRVVLLIGDGSLQLTVQELGSIIRDRLNMVIVVLNNEGYTVERAIHGPEQRYNDIAAWNWTRLPAALGADENEILCEQVRSPAALAQVLEQVNAESRLSLIEVVLPRMDIPALLRTITQSLETRNTVQ
ncbi:indolepyruvate decarboxylase [Pectobacterium punjabense]|uniref:indolepyruvate decarboxylase n=1 Tax=Pectobacterium punjabense TaxID=2108399 RepID=UPI00196917E2|nr:indolepyruvate decarboxylase [Pectobacterium punjabense]MBN3134501.1 indolepyruvate decarboxylase [Pectobacterium punjabense]MCE5380901.1 indolepyruvate decarboxylase [Pectobacterium punjabense]MDG0797423.1 indolepyruvate decarboxylase [Pectobacterium punjabense]